MTSSAPVAVSHGGHSRRVHSNGTPFRKRGSSGGSPIGGSSPPQFATRKMKKTTMCAVRRRLLLARSSGRIKRTEAPVVPRRFASTAPSPSIPVFTSGVPESDPCTWMPPVITNRAPMTTMNPTYSWSFSCSTARPGSPSAIPSCQRIGSETTTAMMALLRFGCHQRGATSGNTAIAASSATNGSALASGSWAPSMGPDTRPGRRDGQAAALDAFLLPHPHRVRDDDGSGRAAPQQHDAVPAGRGRPGAERAPKAPARSLVDENHRQGVARGGDYGVSRLRGARSEEHTSELQSLAYLVCRLLLEKKKKPYEKASNRIADDYLSNLLTFSTSRSTVFSACVTMLNSAHHHQPITAIGNFLLALITNYH